MNINTTVPPKLIIFAIDGASWNILDRVIQKGWMPTLKRLVKKYQRGTLESSIPPMTFPAWIDFATGTNAGKHGCFSFKKHLDYDHFTLIDSETNKIPTFYEILQKAGKKIILVNLPGSFPVKSKNIKALASFLTRGTYYHPENLVEEVPEVASYRPFIDYMLLSLKPTSPVYEYIKLEKSRFVLATKLFAGQWDVFFYLISSYDFLLHRIGRNRPLNEVLSIPELEKFFKEIDGQLKWFLDNRGHANFVIISDHGFKEYSSVFYLNTWLADKGYLRLKNVTYRQPSAVPARISIYTHDARELDLFFRLIFSFLHSNPSLYSVIGKFTRLFPWVLPNIRKAMRLSDWGLKVDDKNTTAYCPNESFLKTNLPSGKLHLLLDELRSLKPPGSSRQALSQVLLSSSVYSGNLTSAISPVVLLWGKSVVDFSLWSKNCFERKISLNHAPEGIFMAFGPHFTSKIPDKVNIRDLTPTILSLFRVKIPKYVDGKTLNLR